MSKGFIKLSRELVTHAIWTSEPFTKGQAWVDILMRVNHESRSIVVGVHTIEVKAGETVWSLKGMAKRWDWSINKCGRFINMLEKENQIRQERKSKYTKLTVVNWIAYQKNDNQERQKRKPNGNETETNKNEKNEKKKEYKVELHPQVRQVYELYIEKFEKNPNQYKLTESRKTKLRQRLKDAGYNMLTQAIENTAAAPFYRGENDRNWQADLDFITRSYEKVEQLSNLEGARERVEFTL